MAGHHVGIDVNGIYRVHQTDFVLLPEDVQNISAIAFRTVGDKDFIVGNLESAIAIVILRDGAPQKLVTLLGAVSVKRVALAHLIHRFVQGGNGRRRQRFGLRNRKHHHRPGNRRDETEKNSNTIEAAHGLDLPGHSSL